MNTNRRRQILEAFAAMLETSPGARITTAALARRIGVSEAALYRPLSEQGEDDRRPHRIR